MQYKIAQLILTSGKKASTASDIFIAQPDTIKESLAGKLFILMEIESKKTNGLKIINFLIDTINRNYYQNEKIILREKITNLKIEHIFEAALAKTNINFIEFLRNEKIKINFQSLNLTIGVIHENMLYFANTGKNKVFLVYKNIIAEKKQINGPAIKNNFKHIKSQQNEYKIFDITQQTATADSEKPDREHSGQKLFANVINGQMPPDGHFIISNEALPEYISNKQLISIVTALPPVSAVEQIKNTLSKINAYVSFLGIIIKRTTLEKSEKPMKSTAPSTQESIVDLNKTEETTENLLTPSGIIDFKKWAKSFSFIFTKKRKKPKKNEEKILTLKNKILVKKKSPQIFWNKKICATVKNIFIYLINIVFYILKSLVNRKKFIKTIFSLKFKIKASGKRILSRMLLIKNLNKKNKILLTLAVISLSLFIINLSIVKIKNKQIKKQNNYEELTALIEQKQNQAEANLLYSNEDGAKKIFEEIKNLMKNFPQETEKQKKQLSQFQKKFNSHMENIRRVTMINDPRELADFINLHSHAKPENITLIEETKKIYSADSSQTAIYILDIANDLITTLTDLKQPIVNLKFSAVAKNNIIYYFNNNNIIELETKKEEINNLSINLIGNHYDFISADTYNNKLYLLNAKDGQIYRYNRVGSGFSSPYAWLQEKTNLSQAVDISIDGHIYVLQNNGEVIKLLRGKKIDFNIEPIDPPFEKPTKLFVSPELKYIYILEPANNRLAVFDKTGQFLMQYQSNKFTNLKDFIVDEQNKILYFLNTSSVFEFEGVHFEE